MIGLGRMGMKPARHLMQGGHETVAYNRSPDKTDRLVAEGANFHYKDDLRRAKELEPTGFHYMDAGSSAVTPLWKQKYKSTATTKIAAKTCDGFGVFCESVRTWWKWKPSGASNGR